MASSSQPYSERVSKIFDRINNIQTSIDSQKSNRFGIVSGLIQTFQGELDEINKRKEEKFDFLSDRLKQLQEAIREDADRSTKMESDLQRELTQMERNSK